MAGLLTSTDLIFAIVTGLGPSLIWLYFWLRRDRRHPEPFGLLFLSFLLGALMVYVAGFLQKETKNFFSGDQTRIIFWAGIEEALKFLVFYVLAYRSKFNDEVIDPAMYLITIALGFAALENVLYILKPEVVSNATVAILTGGMRFFGSTLLHVVASSFIGIFIGLAPRYSRHVFMLLGLAGATFMHATFNIYILRDTTADFLQIYGYLWVAAIITLIIFEKLNRIEPEKKMIEKTI